MTANWQSHKHALRLGWVDEPPGKQNARPAGGSRTRPTEVYTVATWSQVHGGYGGMESGEPLTEQGFERP